MMIPCPYCDHENIPGSDQCDGCGNSLSDLHLEEPASAIEKSLLKDRIAALAPKSPISVSPSTSAGEVIQLLVDKKIGSVLVMDGNDLVGLFTEHDALARIGADQTDKASRPISDFMTPRPQTLTSTAKVAFAVQRMDQGGYRHLPIVDENDVPQGMISTRDILRYLAAKMSEA